MYYKGPKAYVFYSTAYSAHFCRHFKLKIWQPNTSNLKITNNCLSLSAKQYNSLPMASHVGSLELKYCFQSNEAPHCSETFVLQQVLGRKCSLTILKCWSNKKNLLCGKQLKQSYWEHSLQAVWKCFDVAGRAILEAIILEAIIS